MEEVEDSIDGMEMLAFLERWAEAAALQVLREFQGVVRDSHGD